MNPRVPLYVKLLLSYLVVLAALAGPLVWWFPEFTLGPSRVFSFSLAVALTASVLFALVGAVAVSRPLRHLKRAVDLYSRGEFSDAPSVRSFDELQDLSEALTLLGPSLRGRLLSAGAEGATWAAIADELPVGLVLSRGEGKPSLHNATARQLLDLSPGNEVERLQTFVELPVLSDCARTVCVDYQPRDVHVSLPWKAHTELRVRAVAIYADNGSPELCFVIHDNSKDRLLEEARRAYESSMRLWETAVKELGPTPAARSLQRSLDHAERVFPVPAGVTLVEATTIAEVCASAEGHVARLYPKLERRVVFSVEDVKIPLVDSDGRIRRAFEQFLLSVLDATVSGAALEVSVEPGRSSVRFVVRHAARTALVDELSARVGSLGAVFETHRGDEGVRSWLDWPRA